MFQDAAKADAGVSTYTAPKDGKYEVVLPVGLPDEGTLDWLDGFLEKNKQYAELSDRAILAWAMKSGLVQANYQNKHSNDKPDLNFATEQLDSANIKRMILSLAGVQNR